MENDFALMKSKFIEKYNLARPIMTILGDEVRQEILLTLIEAGGTGGIRAVSYTHLTLPTILRV